jgi:hypothetical protein
MKKHLLLSALIIMGLRALAQYPDATISNKLIEAHLYLPDANTGFYRAARFDWSGVVSSLKYKDHEYFGQWYKTHNPMTNDAIQGPVEAFDPIGYDTAKPGETFLKIGVGMLRKVNNGAYRFSTPFELLNGGTWKVSKKKDRVEFTQELHDTEGYAYIYKKTLRLVKNKPELILEHSLKNIGQKEIETNVFNHNFFMIDKQATGPDLSVSFPFRLEKESSKNELIRFENNQLRYQRELKPGESTMEYPTGFTTDKVEDYDIRIENSKTGGSVRITSDRPLSKFMFWSIPTVLSPEPFIHVKAMPGEEFKWNIKYEFYSTK